MYLFKKINIRFMPYYKIQDDMVKVDDLNKKIFENLN